MTKAKKIVLNFYILLATPGTSASIYIHIYLCTGLSKIKSNLNEKNYLIRCDRKYISAIFRLDEQNSCSKLIYPLQKIQGCKVETS